MPITITELPPAATPSPARLTTPVVFFNPGILLEERLAVQTGAGPVVGLRSAPPMPFGTADRLNELCSALAAPLVVTRTWGQVDMRDRLLGVGVRVHFAAYWITDQGTSDRAAAISAWLDAHCRPPAVVIERPGVDVPGPGVVTISIPDSAGLNADACRVAIDMLASLRSDDATRADRG